MSYGLWRPVMTKQLCFHTGNSVRKFPFHSNRFLKKAKLEKTNQNNMCQKGEPRWILCVSGSHTWNNAARECWIKTSKIIPPPTQHNKPPLCRYTIISATKLPHVIHREDMVSHKSTRDNGCNWLYLKPKKQHKRAKDRAWILCLFNTHFEVLAVLGIERSWVQFLHSHSFQLADWQGQRCR